MLLDKTLDQMLGTLWACPHGAYHPDEETHHQQVNKLQTTRSEREENGCSGRELKKGRCIRGGNKFTI